MWLTDPISYLHTLPEDLALKYIANAVPVGLLSTVYRAIYEHYQRAELAHMALSATSFSTPTTTRTAVRRTPNAPIRSHEARNSAMYRRVSQSISNNISDAMRTDGFSFFFHKSS